MKPLLNGTRQPNDKLSVTTWCAENVITNDDLKTEVAEDLKQKMKNRKLSLVSLEMTE